MVALANQVTKCLSYNPEHPRILALREPLLARIMKDPQQYRGAMPALESFLCSFGSHVPEPLRRLQAEVESERTKIEAESQRANVRAHANRVALANAASPEERRERIKELARATFGSDQLKCPLCGVFVKGERLVRHYDKQHGKR